MLLLYNSDLVGGVGYAQFVIKKKSAWGAFLRTAIFYISSKQTPRSQSSRLPAFSLLALLACRDQESELVSKAI